MIELPSTFIFYLHYTLLTAGLSGCGVLLGVFIREYSDASSLEVGILLMSFPFVAIIIRPLFCSIADKYQKHQLGLILSLITLLIGYTPFIALPFFPEFYKQYPRCSWYLLACACHVGNAGLGVGWSLGDALAVNIAQKTGTPYSRMRLSGTVTWGLYGYLIGQINEIPALPKLVPGFLILHITVMTEILFLIFWNKEDFKMGDSNEEPPEIKTQDSNKVANPLELSWEKQSTGGQDKLNLNLNTEKVEPTKPKNLQVVLVKLLLKEDKRLLKYLILYTLFGFFMSPMNFVFMSLPDICKERECNFSELAGTLLASQAGIETLTFLIVPWTIARIKRSNIIGFCFFVIFVRFLFYVIFYAMPSIPPYFAIIGECGHGLSYGIHCTLMADIALMFANESKLFIPELRKMGLLSQATSSNQMLVKEEENKIKVSLRATMQSLFCAGMDGIGCGGGSLLCGLLIDAFSYNFLWQGLVCLVGLTLVSQFLFELPCCSLSDSFRAKEGSKAYEILEAERQERERKKELILQQKHASASIKA